MKFLLMIPKGWNSLIGDKPQEGDEGGLSSFLDSRIKKFPPNAVLKTSALGS